MTIVTGGSMLVLSGIQRLTNNLLLPPRYLLHQEFCWWYILECDRFFWESWYVIWWEGFIMLEWWFIIKNVATNTNNEYIINEN